MKFIFGFAVSLSGAAAALFAACHVSGGHTLLWRWAFVLLALWLVHGAYLCLRAMRASRPLPLPQGGVPSASFCSRPAGYGRFAAHTLLPPAAMRWSTSGLALLAVLAAIYGYASSEQRLILAAVAWLLLLFGVCFRRNVLLYRHLFGGGRCVMVHERGLLLMQPTGKEEAADGIIAEWTSWRDVRRLYRLSHGLAFKLSAGRTYYLQADVGMVKALAAAAPYFRRPKRSTTPPVFTLSTAYVLIDRLARDGALLQTDTAHSATPGSGEEHWGGVPDAGSSFVWPRNDDRPMTHLLQLRHAAGLVNLFVDTDAERTQGEGNLGCVRVAFTPCPGGKIPTPAVCPDSALGSLLVPHLLRRTECRLVPTFADYARTQATGPDTNAATYETALARYEGQRAPVAARLSADCVMTGGLRVEGSATQCPVGDADCHLLAQVVLPLQGNTSAATRLLTITMPQRDYASADFSHIQWDITPFTPASLS